MSGSVRGAPKLPVLCLLCTVFLTACGGALDGDASSGINSPSGQKNGVAAQSVAGNTGQGGETLALMMIPGSAPLARAETNPTGSTMAEEPSDVVPILAAPAQSDPEEPSETIVPVAEAPASEPYSALEPDPPEAVGDNVSELNVDAEPEAGSLPSESEDPSQSLLTASRSGRLWGPGIGTYNLTNRRVTPDSGSSLRHGDEVCIGFRAKGNRIDSIRLFHKYLSGPSSYAIGDGGTVKYTIQSHDSESNHPSGTVLAYTGDIIAAPGWFSGPQEAATVYPGAVWAHHGESGTQLKHFRLIDLVTPLPTNVGAKYWICVSNTSADPVSNWISINNLRNRRQSIQSLDPEFDDTIEARVLLRENDVEWIDHSTGSFGAIAIFEVIGDVAYGQSFYATPSPAATAGEDDRFHSVTATKRLRQVWAPARTMQLSKLYVAGGRDAGTGPLNVRLIQNGTTLFIGEIMGLPVLSQPSDMTTIIRELDWGSVSLDGIQVSSDPLHIELSTVSGTEFEISSGADGDGVYFTSGGFPHGHLEVNDGNGWVRAGTTDLAFGVLER